MTHVDNISADVCFQWKHKQLNLDNGHPFAPYSSNVFATHSKQKQSLPTSVGIRQNKLSHTYLNLTQTTSAEGLWEQSRHSTTTTTTPVDVSLSTKILIPTVRATHASQKRDNSQRDANLNSAADTGVCFLPRSTYPPIQPRTTIRQTT